MMQFQSFFQHWGVLAVFVLLLLENFGLPLPGEVTLLYAGFHQRAFGGFGLLDLIVAGSAGSALGQAGSFLLGRGASGWARSRWLASPRARHYRAFFEHHGPATILFSRFVAGLRMIAGWAAGLAGMPWRPFLLYNLLGAGLWVSALSLAGWSLGGHWRRLLAWFGRLDILILLAALAAAALAWRRLRPKA
ncbi:MAG: DedA family protein [Terriglobales bacterium]